MEPENHSMPGADRRQDLRLRLRLSASVYGRESGGQAFWDLADIENVSAGGAAGRLSRHVSPGARLFVRLRLPQDYAAGWQGMSLVASARVLRVQHEAQGGCRLALAFDGPLRWEADE